MRKLLLAALFCASVYGQNLSVYLHDPSGAITDTALPSSYQFSDTAVGGASSAVVRIKNTGTEPVQVVTVLVSDAASSANLSPNFSEQGVTVDKTLSTSSSSFEDVTVSFTPLTQGPITGYLQIVYQVQQAGCSLTSTSVATQCPSQTLTASTLQGNGTAPALLLTYGAASGSVVLQPNSSSALNFGNTSTSATSTLTFKLTNMTSSAVTTPAVSLKSQIFGSSAFSLSTANLPATIPVSGSGSFTVTFAPGQTGLASATLVVGSLTYPIQGTGEVLADIDALQISYVDADGVRTLPQAATPISMGQVVAGTSVPTTLSFTVTNPTTSWNSVSLSTLAVSGAGFGLTSAPSAPLSIAPGASITFQLVFSPSSAGTYNGTLAIGTRQFSLNGTSITSALPDANLKIDATPLTSQQQAHLTIQLASASTVSAIGQLTMTFTPSVTNVSDDPAIAFVATSGRQLQVTVASGSSTATYNGAPSITFQSGTTAGTLTFTLAFPNKAPITQSFTISNQTIQITNATAVRQAPNLVVTVTAFDNTYSAGKLAFTFYDTSGKQLTANPISIDASAAFSKYFFTNDKAGGAFSLQASFPVTGDVTQVGSVTVRLVNSAGTASSPETFQ